MLARPLIRSAAAVPFRWSARRVPVIVCDRVTFGGACGGGVCCLGLGDAGACTVTAAVAVCVKTSPGPVVAFATTVFVRLDVTPASEQA